MKYVVQNFTSVCSTLISEVTIRNLSLLLPPVQENRNNTEKRVFGMKTEHIYNNWGPNRLNGQKRRIKRSEGKTV